MRSATCCPPILLGMWGAAARRQLNWTARWASSIHPPLSALFCAPLQPGGEVLHFRAALCLRRLHQPIAGGGSQGRRGGFHEPGLGEIAIDQRPPPDGDTE